MYTGMLSALRQGVGMCCAASCGVSGNELTQKICSFVKEGLLNADIIGGKGFIFRFHDKFSVEADIKISCRNFA